MEDKKLLTNEELEKVTGGASKDFDPGLDLYKQGHVGVYVDREQ